MNCTFYIYFFNIAGNVMYWVEAYPLDNKIQKSRLDGTDPKEVFQEKGKHYTGIALDSSFLYITGWNHRYTSVLT